MSDHSQINHPTHPSSSSSSSSSHSTFSSSSFVASAGQLSSLLSLETMRTLKEADCRPSGSSKRKRRAKIKQDVGSRYTRKPIARRRKRTPGSISVLSASRQKLIIRHFPPPVPLVAVVNRRIDTFSRSY